MNKTQKTLYYLGNGLIFLGIISFIFWAMTSQHYGINHTFIILFTCNIVFLMGVVLFEIFFLFSTNRKSKAKQNIEQKVSL